MVVLSAAVCTKNGKALVARQFVGMSRIRIEGLLAAFPKLMGSGHNTQHTFIETDTVRYVYQPIESLFLLLVTNKASNIVEDLETLRLLSKLVPEIAGGFTEDKVGDHMFDLVFAFDEVITNGGHRESITLAQIQTNLLMESHEEKLHQMIEQSKITQAKEEGDRKAKAFREEKRAAAMAGLGSSLKGIEGGMSNEMPYGLNDSKKNNYGDDRAPSSTDYSFNAPQATPEPAAAPIAPKKGMQLGGKSKKMSMMDKLASEDNLAPLAPVSSSTNSSAMDMSAPAPPAEEVHPIMIILEEKISAHLNREGACESMDIKGTMQLTATREDALQSKVVLSGARNPAFTYQTHPKVDKKAYEAAGTLELKDASKGFPLGKSVGVLRWGMSSTVDGVVPISINCWPEPDGSEMNVNVEYTCEKPGLELHNVVICIPLGTSAAPNIITCDSGTHRHNRAAEELIWEIDMIDGANKSAALEFNVSQRDEDAFFPIQVSFRSKQMNAGVDVGSIVHSMSGAPVRYGVTKSVTTDSYKVE